jgi:hypothetical protein
LILPVSGLILRWTKILKSFSNKDSSIAYQPST